VVNPNKHCRILAVVKFLGLVAQLVNDNRYEVDDHRFNSDVVYI